MRGRIPLFVLLASSLTFLASLFQPWLTVTVAPPPAAGNINSIQGLLNQFAGNSGGQIDGWIGGAGDIAVLLVIALVIAGIATLRHPRFAARSPICSLGVALAYFAVAVAVQAHSEGLLLAEPTRRGFHTSWSYGCYLGVASAGVALLSGLAYRRTELVWPRSVADIAAAALGAALLVSFWLPWYQFAVPKTAYIAYGVELAAAVIAALSLILASGWLHGEAGRPWRLPFVIAVAVLTGGAASAVASTPLNASHRYGMWIGIGCAVSLVALEAVRAWPVRVPVLPRGLAAVRLSAAALLIVALFLPWQKIHTPLPGGQSSDGWYASSGAAVGALCLLLLATRALPDLETYALDAIVAIAILVSELALLFHQESFIFHIAYGAFVGIAAAGVLLVTALVRWRPGSVDPGRAVERAVPLALSALCVGAVVLPPWYVLPEGWRAQAAPLYGWFAIPGLLVALYLVRLWALQLGGRTKSGRRLTLVPLVLLTLPALELVRYRNATEVIWGAIILVGLCLILVVFGWVEENRGLEGFRIPEEIWRVDRLPGAES